MEEKELLEKKVSAISLGCDKNRVDLEHMLGKIREYGFTVIDDINDAEIIIVNTCSFIAPAVKEAIDNILIAINQKKLKCEKIIVTGCLTERYFDDIKKESDQKTYLLVAHNGISRAIQSYFGDMTNDEFARFGIRNCEIRKFEYKE